MIHNFDPWEYLVAMSKRMEELTTEHNRMALMFDHVEIRLLRLEKLNRDLTHQVRQLQNIQGVNPHPTAEQFRQLNQIESK